MTNRLIVEHDEHPDPGVDGRARGFLAVNPTAGSAAGLDFTLRHVWGHLTDLAGTPVADAGRAVPADSTWQQRLAVGLDLLDTLLEDAGQDRRRLIGVGVGVPGQIELGTGVVGPSLPGQAWAGVNVAEEFGKRLTAPVLVENNTRLEAVAEVAWGAGRDAKHVFYIGLSSGIGTGLFFDGKLHRGAWGGAGELGHVSVDFDGPACPCGNRGCLVQYAAIPAVLHALRVHLGPDATTEDLQAAVATGDRACLGVIADVGQIVGRVLANLCNLLNPERIIIGGELSRAGDRLLDPMRASLRRHAMTPVRDVDIVAAQLDLGARAGARGGAALVLREAGSLAAALLATERTPV
ncbi:ROK family protein [Nonomuraea sp. 3N208]|uniref:ROK family protein n=1 Tax=Nonomuraea sp. 3N208 TaxID=3457421 RepID=UPI003FCDBE0D